MDFPENVTVELTGLKLLHDERFHEGAGLCEGPGCEVCCRYKNTWVASDQSGVSEHRQQELRNEARALKPVPRFYYSSDQDDSFPVGKSLHLEFQDKGPNVKVRKTFVATFTYEGKPERQFAKYEVVKI